MNITAKDVGREVVTHVGREQIIAFVKGKSKPVVTWDANGNTHTYSAAGLYNLDYRCEADDIIRFADEPEAKPPPETVTFEWTVAGWTFLPPSLQSPRPDLACQTFTYRLEKK